MPRGTSWVKGETWAALANQAQGRNYESMKEAPCRAVIHGAFQCVAFSDIWDGKR